LVEKEAEYNTHLTYLKGGMAATSIYDCKFKKAEKSCVTQENSAFS
jgi:hypothetical protein